MDNKEYVKECVKSYREAVKHMHKLLDKTEKDNTMTYTRETLSDKLKSICLFEDDAIIDIVNTCGTFTMGNAVISCEILDIRLTGNDVDIMFS